MTISRIGLALAACGLAAIAVAGEEVKTNIAIAVVDDASDGEVYIELDGDDLDFNLHDMQEGENRSIVDKSGRTILVTRESDGFTFNVDGKTIKMPAFDGKYHSAMWVGGEDVNMHMEHDQDIDVHVMKDMDFVSADSMDGTMIMSSKPIDEATQQAITSLLESAGHGSNVRFIDHEGPHGGVHGVKVIKRHVDITQ